MKPSIFRRQQFRHQTLDQFVVAIHQRQMKYWASDLLSKGLKPIEIRQAVRRAMSVCKKNGRDIRKHFQLMYTASNQGVSFDDCRMSRLGFRLTVMNANSNNPFVAKFQLKLAMSK